MEGGGRAGRGEPAPVRRDARTLGLLVVAAFALIAALQFAFRARQFTATPAEIEQWYPDADTPDRQEELRREQREAYEDYGTWSKWAARAYNVGVICFLAGFTVALVPRNPISLERKVVLVLAILGVVAELVWVADDRLTWRKWLRAPSG